MRIYFSESAQKRALDRVVAQENGLTTYEFDSIGRKSTYVPKLIQGLTLDEALALNEELGGGCHIDGHIFEGDE